MLVQFQTILVGVDDSPDALVAFESAIDLAKTNHAQLVIASILENEDMNVYQALNKDYIHGERQALEQHLNEYVKKAKDAGVENVRAIIGEGDPGKTIIEEIIPMTHPDLLVIGAKAQKGIAKHFGSQAAYMAKYAGISVLIIREDAE
ncbi:MAG: universal stress protein [Aerococcus sp.]|nr:universal stress protein [Aerococcus sp.]